MKAILMVSAAVVLTGCASISADTTVSAFATATTSASSAFDSARTAEDQAFSDQALHTALNGGTVGASVACTNYPADPKNCNLMLTVSGQPVDVEPVGANATKLAGLLAKYGADLQQLAAAKDIAARNAALQKLSTTLGSLASMAGVPGVTQIGTFFADLEQQRELEDRRELVLAVAKKADGAVGQAGDLLQQEAVEMQQEVVLADSQTVADAGAQFAIAPAAQRPALAAKLSDAVNSERSAGTAVFDFGQVGKAHQAMIASLENPKLDPTAALAEITTLEGEFQKVEGAFAKTGAKKP